MLTKKTPTSAMTLRRTPWTAAVLFFCTVIATRQAPIVAILLMCILASAGVQANDEVLSFRSRGGGEFEAVVSGNDGFCGQARLSGSTSVSVDSNNISINTIRYGSGGGCPAPVPPPKPYEVVVSLGVLSPGTYSVLWTTSHSATGSRLAFLSGALVVDALVTVLEYYHAGFDHYFLTNVADEIAKLDDGVFVGWARTGQRFFASPRDTGGKVPTCRFFSTAFGERSSHFYTPDAAECATIKANPSWQFEGEVFAVGRPSISGTCDTGTAPLYRLFNNGKGAAPNHRFTTSTSVRQTMIDRGWIPEGMGALGVIGCVPT